MRTPFIIAAIAFAACSGSKNKQAMPDTTATAAPDSAVAPGPAATAPSVTDPQIAAIVVAANDVDVAAGRLASTRAHNADVKAFGKQMVVDHSKVNQLATALVKKLNVTPQSNATSEQLTQNGAANLKTLGTKHGSDFDQAYIGNEITYHQTVLDAIDNTLIPSAQNAELKTLLEQTRPTIAAHLQRAQQIQASLKR